MAIAGGGKDNGNDGSDSDVESRRNEEDSSAE
jgi:hypothetical protein